MVKPIGVNNMRDYAHTKKKQKRRYWEVLNVFLGEMVIIGSFVALFILALLQIIG